MSELRARRPLRPFLLLFLRSRRHTTSAVSINFSKAPAHDPEHARDAELKIHLMLFKHRNESMNDLEVKWDAPSVRRKRRGEEKRRAFINFLKGFHNRFSILRVKASHLATPSPPALPFYRSISALFVMQFHRKRHKISQQ